MTEQKAVERLKAECFTGDIEVDHIRADRILLEFLAERGFEEIVRQWSAVDKWYA